MPSLSFLNRPLSAPICFLQDSYLNLTVSCYLFGWGLKAGWKLHEERNQVYLVPYSLPGSALGTLSTWMADCLGEVEVGWEGGRSRLGWTQSSSPDCSHTLLPLPLWGTCWGSSSSGPAFIGAVRQAPLLLPYPGLHCRQADRSLLLPHPWAGQQPYHTVWEAWEDNKVPGEA